MSLEGSGRLKPGGANMELRVLKYFLMTAREENITKAAKNLHITQPTLSRQLMQLEEELGTKLFERSNHNIYLTEDGMLLRKRAQDIVELSDRAKNELLNKNKELTGRIIFGCGETMCVRQLSHTMAEFQKRNPEIKYEIYTAIADEIKERLDKGLIDIGLLTEPVDIVKYNFIRLRQKEQWGVIVREDSPLADKASVTAKDLADMPLIMTKRNLVKSELENWFGDTFERLNIAGTYNLLNNAATMVAENIGVALCFELGVHYDGLKFVPLSPRLETGSVIVWQKNQMLSEATKQFIEMLKEDIEII